MGGAVSVKFKPQAESLQWLAGAIHPKATGPKLECDGVRVRAFHSVATVPLTQKTSSSLAKGFALVELLLQKLTRGMQGGVSGEVTDSSRNRWRWK